VEFSGTGTERKVGYGDRLVKPIEKQQKHYEYD